ncbi:hypothetical protein CEE37_11770 [candidate division LCP-89 bacterium B3_LCP]|uniref:Uncharacterized protein n=1 Tax=candidate division LCP-89 bacterium B3_LCP TaxID=2012998 RepID=A0A532UVZ2_UNCL8|nr:MAG: hypothetical protein CEE37_11770 [candidate division LCP-89 bacterium B3_LCP]
MLPEISRVRHEDRTKDEQIVYANDQFVCMHKLSPACAHNPRLGIEDYHRFFLRFYIPREILSDARKKADRVIVMTNGLDEINHYSLYDELGSRLASRGIISVLLPLPDHLNRHTRFRIKNPSYRQLTSKPSEVILNEADMFYIRFNQYRDEIEELLNHIKGKTDCVKPQNSCFFYKNLFSRNVRVSYLGYSLGAAMMLCAFLENEKRLNACFLLNGAVNLKNVNAERLFDQKKWDKFNNILEKYFSDKRKDVLKDRLFEGIVLGEYTNPSKELLKEHGRRILFLFGGRDQMISHDVLQQIMPTDWGLGMMVLPGINHFLAIDEEWKKWVNLVADLVVSFEENAQKETITKTDLLKISETGAKSRSKKGTKNIHDTILFERANLLGMNPEVIHAKMIEKSKMKEAIKTSSPSDLRIGEILVATNQITADELLQAIDIQTEQGLTRKRKEKIGRILANRMRVVKLKHVDKVVKNFEKENI